MKRRFWAVILPLALTLTLVPPGEAAEAYMDSGSKDLPKLSKAEITLLLRDNPTDVSAKFEVTPSITAPYAPGKVPEAALQQGVDRLNALRRIAGLPPVTLDLAMCEEAQYGAVLEATGGYTDHYPLRPDDMDEEFYQKGLKSTSTSNIAYNWGLTIPGAADVWVEERSYMGDLLGHRCSQLSPTAERVGFGCARESLYTIVLDKFFEADSVKFDYDFISWPASGNFPLDLYTLDDDENTLWSVSVNLAKYAAPDERDIAVSVKRERDGRTWIYSQVTPDIDYGVVPYVIAFPVPAKELEEGVYTVSITGLKTRGGKAASITYQVDLFNAKFYTGIAGTEIASPNRPGFRLNGRPTGITVYSIGGANYFKLRDLAALLSGTAKQFDVGWDGAAKAITLTSGVPYTPVETDGSPIPKGDQAAVPTAAKVFLDGREIQLTAYNINGANYFKLRDVGAALDFGVDWDAASKVISIDTTVGYSAD